VSQPSAGPAPLPAVFDAFLVDPRGSGVFTDFDGTLSPIVPEPASAAPLDGVVDTLESLAGRLGRVAVISGRPVEFLQRHFSSSPVVLSGLYGLQTVVDGERRDDPGAGAWREAVDDVVVSATAGGPDGMFVEHKGLSVTLHYREHPEAAGAVLAWAEGQAARSGLELRTAKMSIELHPPVDTDKGAVVAGLAEGLDNVCFLGDDVGDLPAFAALDRLRAEGRTVVKVVVRSEELAPEMVAAADLTVDGPAEALALLRSLVSRLSA
jgi:trehalose 6-phosphate phosphatase